MACSSVHRVNKCGILYCEGGQKPPERSSCSLTSPAGTCQALVLEGGAGYEPVPEGAKCGEEKVSTQAAIWRGARQLLPLAGALEGCGPDVQRSGCWTPRS